MSAELMDLVEHACSLLRPPTLLPTGVFFLGLSVLVVRLLRALAQQGALVRIGSEVRPCFKGECVTSTRVPGAHAEQVHPECRLQRVGVASVRACARVRACKLRPCGTRTPDWFLGRWQAIERNVCFIPEA
jgi:hypothetical protein